MQTILDKIFRTKKKINSNQTGAENFDNCFCVIFDSYYKSFISGWALSTGNFSKILQSSKNIISKIVVIWRPRKAKTHMVIMK